SAGTHLHRSKIQERHRTTGKAVRPVHQDDGGPGQADQGEAEMTSEGTKAVPSVSIATARTGASSTVNALGMRPRQERAYGKRGGQYLLIKSPPASGKSRALMFIALDKLHNQGLKQAIIVVPEKAIGGSFADEE